jgi:D-tyrosyl-tRNA(Tyr) deacylase
MVEVEGQVIARIEAGLLILLGIEKQDSLADASYLAKKTAALRIFADKEDKMNLSLLDIDGSALVVSQFTLLADCRKGNRPGFSQAAPPDQAIQLYESFCQQLSNAGIKVATGIFQADMQITLVNNGPVTILLDSRKDC